MEKVQSVKEQEKKRQDMLASDMQGEPQDDQDETHDPVSATFIGLILGFTLVLVY